MVKTVERNLSDDLLRSQANADRMRRIAPRALAASITAQAARKAEKARWQTPYPVVNLGPKDRRTREYRQWKALQPPA